MAVEARERSGALITADFALEDGREVLAVPGEITSALSAGTNALLRVGATPATSAADVLEALGLERRPVGVGPQQDPTAHAVLLGGGGARTPDELARVTGPAQASLRGRWRCWASAGRRGRRGGGAQYDRAVTSYWLPEPRRTSPGETDTPSTWESSAPGTGCLRSPCRGRPARARRRRPPGRQRRERGTAASPARHGGAVRRVVASSDGAGPRAWQ